MQNNESGWMPDYIDLIRAQRKLGYSTESAIADIVDNPYDAGATVCKVYLNLKETSARAKEAKVVQNIIFADNGRGMNALELKHALIPASTGRDRKYHNELGCFGCGLVASGLSLGRRIEIFTRGEEGDLYSCLDLDEKQKSNSPVNIVRPCSANESRSVLNAYLKGYTSGTVIWLSNLELVHQQYNSLVSKITYHLSTTYYHLGDKYEVYLDNNKIKGWDFLEKAYAPNNTGNIPAVSDVKTYTVTRNAEGKPIRAEITLQMSWVKEGNPARQYEIMGRTNENQGGALVRYGRMLTRGDMMGILQKNPAHNALRFEVKYNDHQLDDHIFKLTVQKDKCLIIDKDFKLWLDGHVKEFIKNNILPLNSHFRVSNPQTKVKPTKQVVKPPTTVSPTNLAKVSEIRAKAVAENPVIVELSKLDVNNLTSIQALNCIYSLHQEAKKFTQASN